MFPIFETAGSALTTHRIWMNAIADNLANINTVTSTSDAAYQERFIIAQELPGSPDNPVGVGGGVAPVRVEYGNAEGLVYYDPQHPLADEQGLEWIRHVPEVSVEEFIEGEELTFDTICADGEILFENVAWYRPNPLVSRLNPWINPQAICLRDLEVPDLRKGREMGREVIAALGFESGFTHMEWFLTSSGEAVFGEIGGRPPGGRLVHGMNDAADVDTFRGWAEAVTHGRFSQDGSKKHNAAVIFKRAEGEGTIRRVEGLESLLGRYGQFVSVLDLVQVGQPKRDYRKVIVGDGWIVVRHPNLDVTIEMADAFSNQLRLYAS
jgi:flagellar basal body rod protein FlgC